MGALDEVGDAALGAEQGEHGDGVGLSHGAGTRVVVVGAPPPSPPRPQGLVDDVGLGLGAHGDEAVDGALGLVDAVRQGLHPRRATAGLNSPRQRLDTPVDDAAGNGGRVRGQDAVVKARRRGRAGFGPPPRTEGQ